MKEQLFCIVTPQARSYYKATCLAKEFLDKDQNVVNITGTIPDGEITEITTPTFTVKHYKNGKLNGKLEVINLADNRVTFTEQYEEGRLVCITERSTPLATPAPAITPAYTAEKKPTYSGTVLKTSKDARLFYVNGKQVAEETISANGATLELLGDIPDGEVKEFAENGKLKTEAVYQSNKLHGLLIRYDENGKITSKETYEQGVLKGPAEYYSNANKHFFKTQCSYKSSVLDGDFIVTQEDGTVREKSFYTKGRLNGPRRTFYANGVHEAEETFQDGKLQGKRFIFFPTGEVWYEENYENGRLEGNRTEFFTSGKTRLTEFYADGMLNGQCNTYDENGELLTMEEYHWGNIVHNTEYRAS